jgi:hypothetical protein
MTDLHVPIAVLAEWSETFVLFITGYECIAHGAVAVLLAHGLSS